jgi:hypothetical protein
VGSEFDPEPFRSSEVFRENFHRFSSVFYFFIRVSSRIFAAQWFLICVYLRKSAANFVVAPLLRGSGIEFLDNLEMLGA